MSKSREGDGRKIEVVYDDITLLLPILSEVITARGVLSVMDSSLRGDFIFLKYININIKIKILFPKSSQIYIYI